MCWSELVIYMRRLPRAHSAERCQGPRHVTCPLRAFRSAKRCLTARLQPSALLSRRTSPFPAAARALLLAAIPGSCTALASPALTQRCQLLGHVWYVINRRAACQQQQHQRPEEPLLLAPHAATQLAAKNELQMPTGLSLAFRRSSRERCTAGAWEPQNSATSPGGAALGWRWVWCSG